jgi:hypothetical protein
MAVSSPTCYWELIHFFCMFLYYYFTGVWEEHRTMVPLPCFLFFSLLTLCLYVCPWHGWQWVSVECIHPWYVCAMVYVHGVCVCAACVSLVFQRSVYLWHVCVSGVFVSMECDFFFVVLGFELRAYTLSYPSIPFFVMCFFQIGSREWFAQDGFKPRSSWSLPPE